MNAQAPNLLSQIDDIKGLDPISLLPLAPGWWGLLALVVVAAVAGAALRERRKKWERSWRADAKKALDALENRLDGRTAKEVAADLSAILRRIAMQKFSRLQCAGLEGRDWLAWLSKNDPGGFNWEADGKLLTEAPYAPPGKTLPPEKIRSLIAAARAWVT
jgi:hypothetical protein